MELSEEEYEKNKLSADDILMIRSNGSRNLLGRSGIVSNKEENFAYAGYLLRLKPNKDLIYPPFLNLMLHAPQVRKQIESVQKSSSGVNNINAKEVGELNISLPPLPRQQEIADIILSLVDKVIAEQKTNKEQYRQIEKLQQSLLQSMFSQSFISPLPVQGDADTVISNLKTLKESRFKEMQILKKEQARLYNLNFSNTKDPEVVKKFIIDYSQNNFSKNSLLTEEDIQNIRKEVQARFTEIDYDDFSSIFLELIREKINVTDNAPFFKLEYIDGKVAYKINSL